MYLLPPEFGELLTAFHAVPDRVAILDVTGRMIAANQAAVDAATAQGCPPDCLSELNMIRRCKDAVRRGVPGAEAVLEGLHRVAEGALPVFRHEFRCESHDTWRWALLTVTAAKRDGEPRLIVVVQDRSAEHEALDLVASAKKLRVVAEEMDEAIAEVSHELRTPLASLAITAEVLRELNPESDSSNAPMIANIQRTSAEMIATVDNVLEAARLDSGHAKWNFREVALTKVVSDAFATLAPLMPPGVTARSECHDDDCITGDPGAIRRLLLNVLSNALKHTAKGTVSLRVRRVLDEDSNPFVELKVADTGSGMSDQAMTQFREAFSLNTCAVTNVMHGGTGLGLRVCQRIVTVHGGELHIASRPGSGTTVTVRLRADLTGPVAVDTLFQDEAVAGGGE